MMKMWMENKNDKYMFRESYIDPLTEKKENCFRNNEV